MPDDDPGFPPLDPPAPSTVLPAFESDAAVASTVEETDWYSDDVMNLLFEHYIAQAGGAASRVPAVLGSHSPLGINFLETFLTHHLLDAPQSREPIFIPVNLGERHWVGLMIRFEADRGVTVYHFDSVGPQWLDPEVERAVRAALALAGFDQVAFDVTPWKGQLQSGPFDCGPWVVEWLRACLGLISVVPPSAMAAARAEHGAVAGVAGALHRDREARGWGADVDQQFDALETLQDLFREDVWRRFILPGLPPFLTDSSTLLSAGQQLVRSRRLSLGLLYRRFLDHPRAKALAEYLFRARVERLDARYHATKAAILEAVGLPTDDDKRARRPWNEKAPRLASGRAPSRPYEGVRFTILPGDLLDLGPFCCLDLLETNSVTLLSLAHAEQVDWLAIAVFLNVIRKRLVRQWEQNPSTMTHVTVVALPGPGPVAPCFWALNTKDERGNGTTRILLPLGEEANPRGTPRVRVLDLSYQQVADLTIDHEAKPSEVASCVRSLVGALFPATGAELGQTFLDLMSSSADVQGECRRGLEGRQIELERMHCVLLYSPRGVEMGTMTIGDREIPYPYCGGVIHTASSPKTRPGAKILNRSFSALQLAYYFLGIVVAETRHARGAYVSTIDLFELVRQGFVEPADVFSDLGGQIEHGWLLPGANFLGGSLPPELKRLAMPLVGSVIRDNNQLDALPDVLRAVNGAIVERAWSDEPFSIEDPSHPVYQVLQKCLFITLLRFLARCPSDVGEPLGRVTGEAGPRDAWPPGFDAVLPLLGGRGRAADAPPDLGDLGEVLFGEGTSAQCAQLIERAKKLIDDNDVQIFCNLFEVQIKLYTRTNGSWRCAEFAPEDKRALATISLVASAQKSLSGWRVLVPPARRPEDYPTELRWVFGRPDDFERALEALEKELSEYEDDDDDDDDYDDDMDYDGTGSP